MSKKSKTVSRPARDPDHYSKRGVPYWWSPEWVRGTSSDTQYSHDSLPLNKQDLITTSQGNLVRPCGTYGRIHAVKVNQHATALHMKSKDGKLSYIQGSIQKEFQRWHEDRQIDYLLLGMDPDEILASDD